MASVRVDVRWCALLAVTLGLLAPSCGGRARTRHAPFTSTDVLRSDALFCPGEYLKWSLDWKGVRGATSELITGQPGEVGGRPAIIVHSLSRTSEFASIFREVREELTSQISLETGQVLRNDSQTVEDDQTELLEVRYSDASYRASLQGTVKQRRWTQSASHDIDDLHTILATLRTWKGVPATGAFAYVQSGRSYYRMEVIMAGTEEIRTSVGTHKAVLLHGHATRLRQDGKTIDRPQIRQFSMWRSDDERFLPLRFEVETRLGTVRGSLVQFQQPSVQDCIRVRQPVIQKD